MAKSGGRSVLYYGCTGCGVLVAIVAIAVAAVAGVAWMRVQDEQIEDRSYERPVATFEPSVPAPDATEVAPGSGASDLSGLPPVDAAGTVVLDLSGAEFTIRPGEPGSSLAVEASYDARTYALEQDESVADDGTWVWRVRFEQTGATWLTVVQELLGGTEPSVAIVIPKGVPIRLDVDFEQGGLDARLDGLWLTEVEFDGRMGGGQIECAEPAPRPAKRMVVNTGMGGWVVRGVGNLSPGTFEYDGSMGGHVLDLRGAWRADADLTIRNRRGGMQLIVPDDVRIEGLEDLLPTGIEAPAEDEVPAGPALRFVVTADADSVEVSRK